MLADRSFFDLFERRGILFGKVPGILELNISPSESSRSAIQSTPSA